jgi:hypothetical protein
MDPDIPWKVGFSETAGMRNKLASIQFTVERTSHCDCFVGCALLL